MKFLLGKKIEMSQMFDDKGNIVPVTLIAAGPAEVLQKKSKEASGKDGYDAIQFGYEKIEKISKMKKSWKARPYKFVKESKGNDETLKVGDQVNVSIFKEGDKITIVGVSKGKGFQGAVKRHGFSGRNKMHGMKHDERTTGSIGQRFPQHTIKGRRMPGRMGSDRITVKNLTVVKIDAENNLMAVRGATPGRRGTLLEIRG